MADAPWSNEFQFRIGSVCLVNSISRRSLSSDELLLGSSTRTWVAVMRRGASEWEAAEVLFRITLWVRSLMVVDVG